jgi:hypothetical protein
VIARRERPRPAAQRDAFEERAGWRYTAFATDKEKGAKLVLATLLRAAHHWCRVSISDLERHQLTLLRAELGLETLGSLGAPSATVAVAWPRTRRNRGVGGFPSAG